MNAEKIASRRRPGCAAGVLFGVSFCCLMGAQSVPKLQTGAGGLAVLAASDAAAVRNAAGASAGVFPASVGGTGRSSLGAGVPTSWGIDVNTAGGVVTHGSSPSFGSVTTSDYIVSPQLVATAAGLVGFQGRANFDSPADGVIRLKNFAGTDFGLLQFGGTTSSFPALKRSGTELQARLADDSGFATLRGIGLGVSERATDPSDPSEGQSVVWQSDGTGAGDDGDIMVKITAGGVTKTVTLIDFSAAP